MRPPVRLAVADSSPKTELFLSTGTDMTTANLMFKTPVLAALHFRAGVVLPIIVLIVRIKAGIIKMYGIFEYRYSSTLMFLYTVNLFLWVLATEYIRISAHILGL